MLKKNELSSGKIYKSYLKHNRKHYSDVKPLNYLDLNELTKQLPDVIKTNPQLYALLIDTLNRINIILSSGEIFPTREAQAADSSYQKKIRDEIFLLLYKLGVDQTLVGKFGVKIKPEDIVINNVTFDDFYLKALNVFKIYKVEPSTYGNQLRIKLELLFIVLYNVRNIPEISPKIINDIELLVSQFDTRIKLDSTVSVYKRDKGLVNKPANPSQIRGKIMSELTILTNHYRDILNSSLSLIINYVENSVLNVLNSVIKPIEKDFIKIYKESFTYESFFNLRKNSPEADSSYLSEMDDELQKSLLDYIISQPITTTSEVLNVLSEINYTDVSTSRINSLAFETPYCLGVTKILNTKFLRDVDRQYLLEKFSLEYELNFFKYNLTEQNSKAKMALFKENYTKIIKVLDLLINRYTINDFKELIKLGPSGEAKIAILLILYDKDKLASLIFNCLIKMLSKVSTEPVVKNALSLEIGEEVIRGFSYIKKNPFPKVLLKVFSDYTDLKFVKSLGPIEKAQLGLALVEFVLEKLPLIVCNTITVNKRSESIIEFHPNFEKIISKEGMDPLKLPMVCQPLSWKIETQVGGYLTSALRDFNNKDLGFVHQNIFNRFPSEPSQVQYDAVNYLNQQAFVINKDVLNFILLEWNKENGLFGKYNKEHHLTGLTSVNGILPFSKDYKEMQTHNSLYWIYRNIINLAIMYKDTKFYLPTFMDFRGRIYPYVSYLSYQGNDLARALLNFAESETITEKGIEYLQLYMASTYGNTADTFEKRLEWFNANFDNYLNLYLDNPENFIKEVLNQAKEKFQFLSVFLTLVKLYTYGVNTPVGTPILFDCSCSGMQHLSALCSNLTLARMVNVVPAEGRSDFYTIAADYVSETILKSDDQYKDNLSKININRTVMKIPVMTIPYNISLSGITEKLESTIVQEKIFEHKKCYYKILPEFIKGNDKILTLTASEFGILSKYIYNSLYEMVPSLKILTEFLNSLVKLVKQVDRPIIWITPSHLKISLSVRNYESVRTKTKLFKAAKPITISIPGEGYDFQAIQKGFIANFIHSLDAANIHILIKMLKDLNLDYIPLYTIHDCFATTPNNMSKLNKVILSAFIELYFDSNYIVKLNDNIIAQICSYGYDIEEIDGKKYFINRNEESDELIPLPSIPEELLEKWTEYKKIFIDQIQKSSYFIS